VKPIVGSWWTTWATRGTRPGLAALSVLVVLATLALGAAVSAAAAPLLAAWSAVLSLVSPELAVRSLDLADGRVQLTAGIGRDTLVGTHWLAADPRHRLSATVPVGPAVLAPALWGVLALALARFAAWPRALLALGAAIALLLGETPLLLAAAVQGELLNLLSPDHRHPLVLGAHWWNHGGRWLLTLALPAALLWPWLPAGTSPARTVSAASGADRLRRREPG
jgi:hypothetical protein